MLKAQPGSTARLNFKSDSIDGAKLAKVTGQVFSGLSYDVVVRNCVSGEITTAQLTCEKCVAGTYSFNANSSECNRCLENAVCSGTNKIIVNTGHWRSSETSEMIYKCPNQGSCEGGLASRCAPGYSGNLCNTCRDINSTRWARVGIDACTACNNQLQTSFYMVGIVAGYITYVLLMLGIIVRSADRKKDHTTLIRILTNYF